MFLKILFILGILFIILGSGILCYLYFNNYAIFHSFESSLLTNESKIETYQDYIARINFERLLIIISSILLLFGCIFSFISLSFKFSKYVKNIKKDIGK
jgi:tetrahydromethanopterin S-methyltransferase subunit C